MRYAYIAVFAVMALLFSTERVAAQYGPEEIGAEESPIVDPDTERDESGPVFEQFEGTDEDELEAEEPEEARQERGCAAAASSSTPSEAPIEALLFLGGLIAFRRLRHAATIRT